MVPQSTRLLVNLAIAVILLTTLAEAKGNKTKSSSPQFSQSTSVTQSVSKETSRTRSTTLTNEISSSKSITSSYSDEQSKTLTYYRFTNKLVCPANITAGTMLYCIMSVTDRGNFIGSQTCLARLNACGSNSIFLSNGTLKAVGMFQFGFVPTTAGRMALTANYNGTLIGKTWVFVKPAAASLKASGADCVVIDVASGTNRCTTKWRDRFGNIAKQCNTTYVTSGGSSATQCTAL